MEVSSELLVWYFNQQLSIGRMLNWYYADLCSIMISSEKDRSQCDNNDVVLVVALMLW